MGEFYDKYGDDYWMTDLEDYDKKCKVEPLMRSMKETDTDSWINGRRRDHGAERASLPVWEGNKVNPPRIGPLRSAGTTSASMRCPTTRCTTWASRRSATCSRPRRCPTRPGSPTPASAPDDSRA